ALLVQLAQIFDAGDMLHGHSRPFLSWRLLTSSSMLEPSAKSGRNRKDRECRHDPNSQETGRRSREAPSGRSPGGGAGGTFSLLRPRQRHPAAALKGGPSRQTIGLTRQTIGLNAAAPCSRRSTHS